MPRKARVVLAGYPHHVIQRGHNHAPVFVQERDYRFYLHILEELKARLRCKVYAFCLMTNHAHLIISPHDPESLGALMKRVAGRYTRYVNRLERRTGTVWNGRFKSSPIETDRYLLACTRYVELNPVRARIVSAPGQYPWSSFNERIGRSSHRIVDEDPCYLNLGATRREREARYRQWIEASIPDGELDLIRQAVQRGQLSGSSRFQQLVEQRIGRRIDFRGRGRPGTDLFFQVRPRSTQA